MPFAWECPESSIETPVSQEATPWDTKTLGHKNPRLLVTGPKGWQWGTGWGWGEYKTHKVIESIAILVSNEYS